MNAFREVWRNPYVRVLVYLILVYLAWRVVDRVSGIVTLAALGYLFAYLCNPLVEASRRRGLPRGAGVAMVFVIVALFLVLASVIVGTIVSQLAQFIQDVPRLIEALQTTLRDAGTALQSFRFRQSPEWQQYIDEATAAAQNALKDAAGNLLRVLQGSGLNILSGAVGIVGNIVQFFVVFIVGGYMLASFPQVGRSLLELFPRRAQPLVLDFTRDVNTAVGGYIRGQIIIALAVGTMVGIGLAIIGLPLSLTIGFIAGLFNIVPYLGVIIAITPALLLAIPYGLLKVALVVIVFTVANQVEAHLLSPVILSRSTDLHPVTVILAILTGIALYGILGGLLAVPLAALGKLLVRKYWLNSAVHDAG